MFSRKEIIARTHAIEEDEVHYPVHTGKWQNKMSVGSCVAMIHLFKCFIVMFVCVVILNLIFVNISMPAGLSIAKGDVNGDGKLDLRDAILSLQIATNTAAKVQAIHAAADANADGKIGIAEAIYVLQSLGVYMVKGTITSGGAPLSGVLLSINVATISPVTTSTNGVYQFNGLTNGSYTITPSKMGFTFTPATVTINGSDVTQNFTAEFKFAGITAVAAGGYHTVALKNDGTVWTWGYNRSGQLGDGTTVRKSTPIQLSGLSGIIAVAAGHYYTIAVKNNGTVWAWGSNTFGQLGDGRILYNSTPAQVGK